VVIMIQHPAEHKCKMLFAEVSIGLIYCQRTLESSWPN